jgi:purine-binding chemotaxis protein CheW
MSASIDQMSGAVNNGAATAKSDFVTFTIAEQYFGIPVLLVQDVLRPQAVTHVYKAPPEIAGLLNLRGRIVTAIDIRQPLGLPCAGNPSKQMSMAVESGGDLYSFLVDSVGDVLSLADTEVEPPPSTLNPRWREVTDRVYRLEGRLLLVLNIERLLALPPATRAA